MTAVAGTRIAALCGHEPFVGFHWCNFGLSPAYVDRLAERALVVSARADDAGVEAVELPEHPFFVATLSSRRSERRPPGGCIQYSKGSLLP